MTSSDTRYERYTSGGQYRWRLISNGRIISVSSEGYSSAAARDRGIEINRTSGNAPIIDV